MLGEFGSARRKGRMVVLTSIFLSFCWCSYSYDSFCVPDDEVEMDGASSDL